MGWIAIDRKLLGWEYFTDGNMLKVWLYLLLNAKYEDCEEDGMTLKRGEVATSYRLISEACGISIKAARIVMDKLEGAKQTAKRRANQTAKHLTIVTICNYESYQSNLPNEGQSKRQSEGQSKGQSLYINKTKINNNISLSPTLAREILEGDLKFRKEFKELKKIDEATYCEYAWRFLSDNYLGAKTWTNADDLKDHFTKWFTKSYRRPRTTSKRKREDEQRAQERRENTERLIAEARQSKANRCTHEEARRINNNK